VPGAQPTVQRGSSARRRRLVAALLAASVAMAVLGNAFTPALLRLSPKLLLAVQSSYAQMGLAAPLLDPAVFIALAATRRWLGELVAFCAGRVLGPPALERLTRRTGRLPELPARLRARRSLLRDALVVVVPHPLLSALFGMSEMPARRFVGLKLLGSLLSVTLLWSLAAVAAVPLATAAAFVDTNAALLTAAAVALLAVWWLWQRRAQEAPRGD
jgi:membrane protein DedA with SNARE-associated domain